MTINEKSPHNLQLCGLEIWGDRRGSNPRQPESQSGTLPTELRSPLFCSRANMRLLQKYNYSIKNKKVHPFFILLSLCVAVLSAFHPKQVVFIEPEKGNTYGSTF